MPLCIDGLDITKNKCFNKEGYTNDAIDVDDTRGKCNAEFRPPYWCDSGISGDMAQSLGPILYKLTSLLYDKGYQAPAQPTSKHANPPTEKAELPTGEELVLTEDETTLTDDTAYHRKNHGDTRIKGKEH